MLAVQVPLSRGLFALVDEADAAVVLAHRWYAVPARATFYAARRTSARTIYLHRELLGLVDAGRSVFTDHDDGDGLNNRRANLVVCTPAQNSQKRRSPKSASGMRGVWKHGNRFVAQIGHAGRFHYLGSFDSASEASVAYAVAAKELFGNFAPRVGPCIS